MKILLFTDPLPELVLSGKKTVTRRVEDQRWIKEWDELSLWYNTGVEFAQAIAIRVKETTFGELTPEDFIGHEKFANDEEMYKRYTWYYHKDITPQTRLKIIEFKLTQVNTSKYNDEDMVDHDAVFGIIKDNKGNILFQEHVKYDHRTLPWGKVRQDQSLLDWLQQEIMEECNITILGAREIISEKHIYDRNNKKINVIEHIFEVSDFTGEIQNNEPHKHSQLLFKSLDEIKKLPHLSHVAVVYLETLGITRKYKI